MRKFLLLSALFVCFKITQGLAQCTPPATSVITGPVCSTNGAIGLTYSVINTPGSSYAWIVTSGSIVSGTGTNNITVNWGAGGVGSVQVTETNSLGCVGAVVSLNVSLQPPPAFIISGSNSTCANSIVQYSVPFISGYTYDLTITGGTKVGTMSTTGGNNFFSVNWGAVGSGNISLTISNGCSSKTASLPVTINSCPPCVPPITSSISGASTVCQNTTSNYSVINTVGSTYTWTITGGTLLPFLPNSNSIQVNWTTAGTGNVSVVETSSGSGACVGSPVNFPVTVNPPPAPFTITGSNISCANTNGVVYSVPNVPGVTYQWSVADGTIVSGADTYSVTVNWGSDLSKETNCWGPCGQPPSISVIATSSIGCTNSASMSVTLNKPSVGVSPYVPNICPGGTATLIPSSGGTWTSNSPAVATVTSSGLVTGVAPGTGSFSFTESSAGCKNTISLTVDPTVITITSQPSPAVEVCKGTSSFIQVSVPAVSQYQWYSNSVNSNTGGTPISGSTYSYYYPNSLALGTTYYYVVCSNSCGASVASNVSAVTVITPPSVTTHPSLASQTACQSSPITPLSVSGTGSASLTYQWFFNNSATPGTSGSSVATAYYVPGATGPTCNPAIIAASYPSLLLGTNYYWAVVTNSCGQAYSNVSGAITINQATSIINQNTPSQVVCKNASVIPFSVTAAGTGTLTYKWYSNTANANTGGTAISGETNSTFTPPSSTAGTTYYYVVVTGDCGSITSNVSGAITVNSPVTSVTTQPSLTPQAPCQSTAVTPLSVSVTGSAPISYQWLTSNSATPGTIGSSVTSGVIIISGATGASYTPTYSGANYYWVMVGNSCGGAFSNVSGAITLNPSVTITSQNTPSQTICLNGSAMPISVTATGNVALTYQWYSNTVNSNTGGSAIGGANSSAFTPPASVAGTTYYYAVVSSPCVSATSNVSGAITIKNVPNPVIIGNSPVCANANGVTYSVTNNTGSTYNWSVTGGSLVSGQGTSTVTVNWGATNPGIVTVTETNSGCSTTVNKSITINPLPVTGTISGPAPVCANTTGAVYSVTNTTGSTYAWTVTGTGSSLVSGNGTNSIIVNWGTVSGSVKVVETSAAGCVGAQVSKSVTVNANPNTSSIGGSVSVCPNSIGNIYSVTNTSGSTYSWTITGGTKATGGTTNSITVTWGAGGAGNVSVIETNIAGCVGTAVNKAVAVGPLTSPIAGSVNVCPNSNGIAYSVANVTGDTYTWTATGGTVVCGQNTSTILVNWGATGPGTLNVTERSATCTGVAVNLPVTITPTPSASVIIGSAAACANSTGASYSVTNTTGSTYAWTVTGGTLVSGAGTNNITVNWSASGTGDISVIETTSTGCVGTAVNKIITISSVNTGIISGNSSMCLPANGIVYSVANTAGSTYAWSINGGTQASGGTTNSITVNWGPAGPGSVNVRETNSAGCVGNTITESVLVNPKPLTSLISGNAAVCANATGVSYSVTNTTGSSYVWTIAGGTQASGTSTSSITVNWGAAGVGNASVVETNYLGCVGATVGQSVTINAKPAVSISASSYTICSSLSSSTLTASGASSYSWSTGASTAAITVNPSSTTTYTVTGTTNGCSSTASATITVGSGFGYVTPSSVDLCTTTCATLQAGSGTNYSWSTGSTASSISVCSVGTYTVHYTVNGCNVTASANVYQGTNNQPPIQVSVDPVDAKKVEVSGKSTTMAFTQTTGSGVVSVPKDVNHIDTYTPCGPLPQPQQTAQLEKESTSFSIYPNPAFTHATVVLSKVATEDSPVLWFDMSGRQVKTSTIEKGNKEKTFQIDELDAGVYLVRVKDNGQLRYSKIIVTK